MSTQTIYRTTSKSILFDMQGHREADELMSPYVPSSDNIKFVPDGEWQLVNAACNENTIYWFWKAEVYVS